jgi:TolA-binding protein
MLRATRILGPALLLGASACWVPLERGQIMDQRLDKLEASSERDAKSIDDLRRRIEEQEKIVSQKVTVVDKKIVEVQQKIDELNQASRRSGADLGVSVTRMQDELAKAKGDLEVQQHDLAQQQQRLVELQQTTDSRFAALRGRGALDEAEAKQLIEGLPRPDDKAAIFALGQQQEQKGSTGVARAIYDEYVRRFPGDAKAPAAAVRSGALSAGQGRWKESFVAYGWVYKNAPRADQAPEAMLGMANAMLELDELKPDAPAMLNDLVQKFPKSPEAAKAKAMLAEMNKKQPKKPKKGSSK